MLYYAPLLITAANSMTLNHILSTLQDIPLFYIYEPHLSLQDLQ